MRVRTKQYYLLNNHDRLMFILKQMFAEKGLFRWHYTNKSLTLSTITTEKYNCRAQLFAS